jgi:sugar lactone lactonase YvrE
VNRCPISLKVFTSCLAAVSFSPLAFAQTNLFVGALKQGVIFEFSSADDVIFTESTFTGLAEPETMVFDSSGNLFVSNGSAKTIKKITPSGVKTTFASGVDVVGMAFDAFGNLFVSQKSKDTDASEGIILEFAPDGSSKVFASNLTKPQGLAFDSLGNLYVADPVHDAILKISPDGRRTTFASKISQPHRLAFDRFGNLYVTDPAANSIFSISPSGVVTDIEDFGTDSASGGTINDLAFDSLGNLFVTFGDTVIEFPGGVDVAETTIASVPGGAGGIAVEPPLPTNSCKAVTVLALPTVRRQHSPLAVAPPLPVSLFPGRARSKFFSGGLAQA